MIIKLMYCQFTGMFSGYKAKGRSMILDKTEKRSFTESSKYFTKLDRRYK